jgi:predicted TIM-barrel fold metal-dependent hydrolase
MLIVDAQIHLWSKGLPILQRRTDPYSDDQAIVDMDAAGIDAALVHPPSWDADSNEIALAAAQKWPHCFAVFGRLALDRPESATVLSTWKDRPGMLGLRCTFVRPEQKIWPTDGTIDWLWPLAEQAGIPIALLAGEFLPLVGRIAERHAGLKLIVDHMGTIHTLHALDADDPFKNLPELLALAKYQNVAVKVTGGPAHAADGYPFRSLHGFYHRIYDAFGPTRMFWGSDVTRMTCSWRQCITHFTEELSWLTDDDRAEIMGRALCRWIDWRLATLETEQSSQAMRPVNDAATY